MYIYIYIIIYIETSKIIIIYVEYFSLQFSVHPGIRTCCAFKRSDYQPQDPKAGPWGILSPHQGRYPLVTTNIAIENDGFHGILWWFNGI